MIQGLLFGLAKQIALKYVTKQNASGEHANDTDFLNAEANKLLPTVTLILISSVAFLILFVVWICKLF